MEEVFKIVAFGRSQGVPWGPIMLDEDYYNEDDAKRAMIEIAVSANFKGTDTYLKYDKFSKLKKDDPR